MNHAERKLAGRRRYYLTKMERALDMAGIKCTRYSRSVCVEVWKHPSPSKAKCGETVAQDAAINWNPDEGFVWYEGGLRNPYHGRHASNNVETIVAQLQKFIADIAHIPAMP